MDGSKKLPFCAKHFRHSCRNCLLRVRVDILRQLNAFGKKWFHIQLRKFSQMVLTGMSKLPTPCPEVFFGILFASKKRFNTYFRILSEEIGHSTKNSAPLSKLHCISQNGFLRKTNCFQKLSFCNSFGLWVTRMWTLDKDLWHVGQNCNINVQKKNMRKNNCEIFNNSFF